MMSSRLPLPSVLGLFGVLLMLSPELLLGRHSHILHTDPEMQAALAAATEQYNEEESDSTYYYKAVSLRKLHFQGLLPDDYNLKVVLVKTACRKKASRLTYKKIQECQQRLGNHKKRMCYFRVRKSKYQMFGMILETASCH